MKYVIVILAVLISTTSFGQSKKINGNVTKDKVVKVENVKIEVSVDSADDLESNFKIEDLRELFKHSSENEAISIKIICNGKKRDDGIESHVSYKVDGNSNDIEGLIKSVEVIRKAAVKYYNDKK
ncbi:hypothetical protein [Winogradskyella ursingii]|uniref:hypothetical protein n=1 Tax=Winogradskyella ursingii TaxID=2686079 RepID=UPI0015CA5321|nr:hypothetical protein [Winogradskyella ursingii]